MLGIKIETTQILDAELMGNAITAFVGMNLFSSLTEGAEALVKTAQVFELQLNSKAQTLSNENLLYFAKNKSYSFDIDSTLYTNPFYA